ncbi:TPA: hypothetical protein ACGR4I_000112 [Citrobacter freundii]
MTALNKQARLVSPARISEIANGANLIMGEKEWLANTAIYLDNELKTATKAFQSTGFSLLEAEEKLEAAENRIAELESAFPDGWQFEECESEGCENGAIFNVGTGINNIHVCEKCASEERYFRLKKSALPKRLPFKFATGIGVKGE